MTQNIFSQIVPLIVAMVLPAPMLKSIRYLLAGRPILHSILMIITWGITCFLVLGIAILLKDILQAVVEIHLADMPSRDFTGWMHLGIGFIFVVIGIKKLKRSLNQNNAPVAQQSIEITPYSIVKATIHTELFGLKNAFLMLLMIYILLKSNKEFGQSLIVSGMIEITSMIWISIPLFVYIFTGRERDHVLELLKKWLTQNKDTLIIFIYLFIGISTLSSGIGELIPRLLEQLLEDVV